MLLPRAYGGEEVDLGTWFRAMEALAKLDGSTAWCVGQMNGCAATACAVDPAVARDIWGPPRAALSWGPPLKARADEVDGGHRVSGEWQMSSGSRHATWIGLTASVFDRNGAPVPPPPGTTAACTFFVPADAVTWVDSWDVIGLNATNSGGYKVEDRFVPKGYSAYRERILDTRIDTPLYKFPLNTFFSIGFSAVALGLARAMLDAAVALAEKKPRAAKYALGENHLVQFQIGDAEARLRSARGYVESTAERVWQTVVATGELTTPLRIDVRMATTFAIGEAKTVADVAWETAGATAIFASSPFERRYRDLRTMTQQMQGRKTHLQDVGAYLLGLEPGLQFA
jgi:alkylation response protein AidB-like acyl-CoA dehydrogenase